jgi:ribonuclease P protein component
MPRFPRKERLGGSGEFKAVFQQCRKFKDAHLALYVQFSGTEGLRKFGVSVGRSHGKAHQRNLVKRRLREIYRVEKAQFRGGYQIIAIPQRAGVTGTFEELRRSFQALARRAGLPTRTMGPRTDAPGGGRIRGTREDRQDLS